MKYPKIKKTLLTLGLITAGFVGTQYFAQNSGQHQYSFSNSVSVISPANAATGEKKIGVHPLGDQVMGKKDAPIVMVEFASFTCPHCAHFHNKVFPQIKKNFIDTGKVRFIYRDFPLDNTSLAISMITRCVARDVGNDKFFPLIKMLFDSQQKWTRSKDLKAEIVKITKLAGYGESKFDSCLTDKSIQKGIRDVQRVAGEKLGIRGTPTLFINGELYGGNGNFESIAKHLNAELK